MLSVNSMVYTFGHQTLSCYINGTWSRFMPMETSVCAAVESAISESRTAPLSPGGQSPAGVNDWAAPAWQQTSS